MAVNPDADASEAIDAILADLYDKFGPKTVFVPIPSRSKGPQFSGWSDTTVAQSLTDNYQKRLKWAVANGNLGIILGPTSNNLVSIDCDKDEYIEEFLRDNSWAKDTIRTIGAHGCQFWFRMKGDYPAKRIIIRNEKITDNGTIKSVPSIEFRGGGGLQSVVYGLHRDTAQPYRVVGNKVLEIEYSRLSAWIGKDLTRAKSIDDIIDQVTDDSADYEESLGKLFPGVDFEELDIVRLCEKIKLHPASTNEEGKFKIRCPWSNEHSTRDQPLDTVIWKAEINEWPNFHCFHAHCKHRRIGDLLKWAERQHSGIVKECALPQIDFSHNKILSWIDYNNKQINEKQTLLGDRWVCRGAFAIINAASGVGKSVFVAQASIMWAIGQPAFDIHPINEIKSLIIQSEDDEGDLIEMSRIIKWMKIDKFNQAKIARNTAIITLQKVWGETFLKALPILIQKFKPDLVWINPYTAYSPPLMDEGENNKFLRHGIAPILSEYNCGGIIMHHNPKPTKKNGDKESMSPLEYSYAMAGWALMTNIARATLAIDIPGKNDKLPTGTFKFIAAKRGNRIGWEERETYWSHSDVKGQLIWLKHDKDEIDKILSLDNRMKHNTGDVLNLIDENGSTFSQILTRVKIPKSSLSNILTKAISTQKIKKIGKKFYVI